MTNEDDIQFIIKSQSRISASLEALVARQDRFQEQLEKSARQIEETGKVLGRLTEATYNVVGLLSGRINDLVEQGHRTDERISAVVNMVEKWIAENQRRRNGHGE